MSRSILPKNVPKMRIEPTTNPKRVKKALKHTQYLIEALDDLVEKDRFFSYPLKAVLWQLSALKRLLEREEEKLMIEKLKRLRGLKEQGSR